ncbi:MAG: hypothetical protein ACI9XO_002619 [Paraglaciecola sp.]|jgi:hypothetical protein
MAHYNFTKDLVDAQIVEQEVLAKLQVLIPELTNLQLSTCKEFDISADWKDRQITFEVKNDLMAAKTGNAAIEYECRGKPSGIAVTKADYLVYKIKEKYFIFRTKKVKRKLFKEAVFFKKAAGGDVGSNTRLFLVKLSIFEEWGVQF